MRGFVAALMLCPCTALADHTVETKDGDRIVLRNDGTYSVLKDESFSCKEPDKYTKIDARYRKAPEDLWGLASRGKLVCVLADIQAYEHDFKYANFKYSTNDNEPMSIDGNIIVKYLSKDDRDYITERCTDRWCQAVVYGRLVPKGLEAERIEFAD